jgi:hypothetical protein
LAPLIRHNVVLPLGESARIGGDGEDLLWGVRDLDR